MSSESVAESSLPVSAAATVEAGKKRGRPPAGQVTIKLDVDTRLGSSASGVQPTLSAMLTLQARLLCRCDKPMLFQQSNQALGPG